MPSKARPFLFGKRYPKRDALIVSARPAEGRQLSVPFSKLTVQRNTWIIQVLPSLPRHHYLRYPCSSKSSLVRRHPWSRGYARRRTAPGTAKPLPERMRLRVERQTLRRLLCSDAIDSTICVYMTPLAELEAGRLA